MKTTQAEKAERQYKKMTQTPVTKLVLMLSVPTIISMLVSNIYNIADTYFVSSIGTSASGAVGIVFALQAIIQAFGFMIGHGTGSLVASVSGERMWNEPRSSPPRPSSPRWSSAESLPFWVKSSLRR